MKKNLSEIVFILDESGSMGIQIHDVIGGFNTFITQQKEVPGEAIFSLVTFSNDTRVIHDRIDLNKIPDLTTSAYVPGGSTALLDCIGNTINRIGSTLRETKEELRPENIIFVIMTDGEENASKEFNLSKISDMIKHQTDKYSWQFIYMGANQDSFSVAGNMSFSSNNINNYEFNSRGITKAYTTLSADVTNYRSK